MTGVAGNASIPPLRFEVTCVPEKVRQASVTPTPRNGHGETWADRGIELKQTKRKKSVITAVCRNGVLLTDVLEILRAWAGAVGKNRREADHSGRLSRLVISRDFNGVGYGCTTLSKSKSA